MNRNAEDVRWLALDHAARSVRRAAPDASGDELARLTDDALGFEPGRGHSRDQALLVVWRGALVNTVRQAGVTLAQIAERLCAIEGSEKPLSTRHLIDCGQRAAEFEIRIDGSSWVSIDAGTTRGLSSAREAYRRAQQRVIDLNHDLLLVAGSVETAREYALADDLPHGLHAKRITARQRRDRAARVYRERIDAGLPHIAPDHRPVTDPGSRLQRLEEAVAQQRDEQAHDAAEKRRPVRPDLGAPRDREDPFSSDPVASLTGDEHESGPGKERSRRSRAARGEGEDGQGNGLPYLAHFKTESAMARIARLRERLGSELDPAKRAGLEAQIVGLR